MNILTLKMIALFTMITDHYGAIFQNNIYLFRIIGRIAFPIYCFLLVEGYFHTSNVKKYAIRLLIFALISEAPFDLAFYNKIDFVHQNVFFTLLIGLIMVYFLDNKQAKYKLNNTIIIIMASILSLILSVDYNIIGIIYILAFYYTKSYPKSQRFIRVAIIMFLTNFLSVTIQQFSLLSLLLLYLYNGELGPQNRFLQILFYVAYPLHLILFYFFSF